MSKLTIKQKRFVDEYIISGNATDAAIKAGYSKKYAGQNADKLLKNTKVRQYIDVRLKELDDAAIMKQEEVLKLLTKTGRREEQEYIVVTVKNKKSYFNEDGNRITEETEEPKVVPIPAKLSDANKALELLGKRYGTWTEKVDLEIIKPEIVFDVDDGK